MQIRSIRKILTFPCKVLRLRMKISIFRFEIKICFSKLNFIFSIVEFGDENTKTGFLELHLPDCKHEFLVLNENFHFFEIKSKNKNLDS